MLRPSCLSHDLRVMRSDRPRNQPLGEAQNAADVCVYVCVYDKKLGDVWNQRSVRTLGDRFLTGMFPSLPKQRRVFPSCEAELASIGCKFSLSRPLSVSLCLSVCLFSVSISVCLTVCVSLFLSVYTPFTSHLIHISYVLNMFGFFFFYIFCSLCMCIISRIALVPHGRGLDVKRPSV